MAGGMKPGEGASRFPPLLTRPHFVKPTVLLSYSYGEGIAPLRWQ